VKNKNIKTVFIVGSKPDINYPDDVMADVIFGVNGGISRIQNYNIPSYGVITNLAFTNKDSGCKATFDNIKDSIVDKLFVTNLQTQTEESQIRFNQTNLKNADVNYLDEIKLNKIKNKYFPILRVFKNYGFYGLYKFMKFNIKGKKNKFTHISTGMLALALVLEEYKNEEVIIYMLGIGIDPNSGHFYDQNKIISDYHLEKDKEFIKNVVKSNNNAKIYATDSLLSEYLGQLK